MRAQRGVAIATAAELAIVLKAKDEASAVLKKVSAEVGGLDKAGASAGKGMSALGAGFKVASVAAGAILTAVAAVGALKGAVEGTVGAAVGFEQAMSGIKAVSGASAAQMQDLSKKALDLGRDTSFSAQEAAAGISELVKGGVSIGDVMGGAAASALDLAAAGGVSVAEAATIAANAMNQFGIKGEGMAHVADLVAGAANASSISVSDFNQSLASGGSVAAMAGQSIDSFATAVALMGAQGIKGSDAGTSLKAAINNLIPTTDTAKAKMQELGIITADGANQFINAEGGMKSFGEIAEILQTQTAGLTESQRLLALELIFGSDGMRAAGVLAKEGGEGFDEMSGAMLGAGTAAQIAAARLDNAAGDIEQLKGSLETAGITVGSLFIPALRAGAQAATAMVNTFTQEASTIIATAENIASEHGIGMIPAVLTAVELRIGEAFGPRAQAIFHAARSAVELLAEGFGAVADFVAAAVPQVLDFVDGVITTVQESEALAQALEAVGGVVTAVAGFIEAHILPAVSALIERFTEFATAVAPLVEDAFAGIQNIVGTVLSAVGSLIQSNLALFAAQWAEHGATIQTIAAAFWGALSGIVEAGLTVIGGTITTILQIISGDFAGAWETMKTTAVTALGQLAGAIGALAGPIGAKAAEIGQAIVNGIANAIRGGIGAVTQAAAGLAQSALNAAKAQLGVASPSREFAEIGEDVVAGLVEGIESVAGDAADAVADMVEDMTSAASGFNLVDSLLGDLDTGGQDALANFLRDSERVMEDVGRKAEEIGRKTMEALADAREDAAGAIQDVREGAAGRALELVDNQQLSREIRAVRARFGEQQDEAAEAYERQQEDAEATYKFERDLAKAKTADEKAEVRARFAEAQDDLRRRRQQEDADRAFRKQQAADLQAFNDRLEDEALQRQVKRLQEERDERIAQITEALAEKERKVLDNEVRERAALAQSASDKLNDLKERFYDKVGPLTEAAKGKFEELFRSVAEQVAGAARAVTDLADAIARVSGAPPARAAGGGAAGGGGTWADQPQSVRDMFTATHGANAQARWEWEHNRELAAGMGIDLPAPTGTDPTSGLPTGPGYYEPVPNDPYWQANWDRFNPLPYGTEYPPQAFYSSDSTSRDVFGGNNTSSEDAYATGGIVPGPAGIARRAVVHGGEGVFTPDQMAALARYAGGDGGGYAPHGHDIVLDGRVVGRALEPYVTGAAGQAARLALG